MEMSNILIIYVLPISGMRLLVATYSMQPLRKNDTPCPFWENLNKNNWSTILWMYTELFDNQFF